MNNQDKFSYNFFAALHNLNLTAKAEQLINNFIGDGSGIVYAVNPDGEVLKLQKGVRLVAINDMGIIIEDQQ